MTYDATGHYFSEIFKLIVFVSQQIDQWFDRINLLKDDSGSTFTAMPYGLIGGREGIFEAGRGSKYGLYGHPGGRVD